MKAANAIQVKNLTKTFGEFTAVNNISFHVGKGEVFGFLGANGAGKTTAMKMLIGILKPTSGKAQVANYDITSHANDVKKNIGYMSQRFSLYNDLTIKENITFFGGIYGLKKATIKTKTQALINDLGLHDEANKLVGSLPLGWKQKVAFSVSLLHDPQIIFLDEPTGGVDPITRRQFWEMIYREAHKGKTIFVTTHYMDEAEYCDRVSIMVEGKIEALDSPKNLKTQYKVDSMNQVFLKLARNIE
ncbi:ABC transporter ATP-binding protein [Maribacter sp. TH_r10]|uniref:ATP-binding cassette domain-containing protein n=1 Tax=Maribacter luteus TaxID=2594478 RepID=A0A6I2MLV9_9FLAO|nr:MULTISPECIES: ABC transporter ATP-binding protein [Maribacter]MDV7139854.1 ABC transporter ATP-binding protein [Maribacter sp. TH_r10]MRX63490.1 ATP-binding cassette domain-containing protein [Maribacter luteus]